jgi:hypothetical protein
VPSSGSTSAARRVAYDPFEGVVLAGPQASRFAAPGLVQDFMRRESRQCGSFDASRDVKIDSLGRPGYWSQSLRLPNFE